MTDLVKAIQWGGSVAIISMFVVSHSEEFPEVTMVAGGTSPATVKRYLLEDDREDPVGYPVHEFDAWFAEPPVALADYLVSILAEALQLGALVVWLGFEGTFNFAYLLSDDIADQIYGLGSDTGVSVAIHATERRADVWIERVRKCHMCLPEV